MLEIIICEDDDNQRKSIEAIIEGGIKKVELETRVALSTGNWKSIISFLEASKNTSFIYFLDVEIGEDINGIELGKKIREYDPKGYIIFVTSHYELSLFTYKYKVQAMDYIIKDTKEVMAASFSNCIKEAINDYKNMMLQEKNYLQITQGKRILNINFEDIIFFETTDNNHKIRLHSSQEEVEFFGRIKEIEKKVPSYFFKVHRAYVINTQKIKEIDKEKLIVKMINGQDCYISKLLLRELIENILD